MGTRPAREHLPTAVMAVGELSSLTLLAPLEYQTGQYVGLPDATAWTITGVVYAVTVLAILTSRLIPAAFALVWLSGAVGVLHSASEAAKRSGEALDRTRAATSIAVVTIVVLAMAAAWWLAREWHRRADERRVEAQTQARTEEDARAVRREREAEARRAHELEMMRLQQAAAREAFDAEMEAARTAHAAELEAARAAHAGDLQRLHAEVRAAADGADAARSCAEQTAHDLAVERDRTHGLEMDLATARATLAAQRTEGRTGARAGRTGQRTTGARRAAEPAARDGAQGGDLQRRAHARAEFEKSVRSGRALDNTALARLIYGIEAPESGHLRAASARASEWRRAIEREAAQERTDGRTDEPAESAAAGAEDGEPSQAVND